MFAFKSNVTHHHHYHHHHSVSEHFRKQFESITEQFDSIRRDISKQLSGVNDFFDDQRSMLNTELATQFETLKLEIVALFENNVHKEKKSEDDLDKTKQDIADQQLKMSKIIDNVLQTMTTFEANLKNMRQEQTQLQYNQNQITYRLDCLIFDYKKSQSYQTDENLYYHQLQTKINEDTYKHLDGLTTITEYSDKKDDENTPASNMKNEILKKINNQQATTGKSIWSVNMNNKENQPSSFEPLSKANSK